MRGFSSSMKRATILFRMPDVGQSIYQEPADKPSETLRACIKVAYDAFNAEYDRLTLLAKEPNNGK